MSFTSTVEELEMLISVAPQPIKGAPTTQQIQEHRAFKEKVKKFVSSQPPDCGRLTYNGIMKMIKARHHVESSGNKRAGLERKRTQKNATTRQQLPNIMTEATVDYICILDFEATCNNSSATPQQPQEIVEFPALLMNVKTGMVESTFHFYIKPDVHPMLSPFCTELTGITQETTDGGISLKEALQLHQKLLDKHNLVNPDIEACCSTNCDGGNDKRRFYYATCGDWDLQSCLPEQLAYHGVQEVPAHFQSWINLKRPYQKLYRVRGKGMTDMLGHLDLRLEGRHHSGIDDCRNLARICARMLEDGWVPKSNGGAALAGTLQFWNQQVKRAACLCSKDDDGVSKTVFLIRHGQSLGQVTRGDQRVNEESLKDCGLTQLGVRQAHKVREYLSSNAAASSIECVISSPLRRALHTALVGFDDKPIVVHYDLGEVGADIPENTPRPIAETIEELTETIEGRSAATAFDFTSLQPPNWPSAAFKASRAQLIRNAFKWMFAERKESVLAVVCHYNVIRTALQIQKGGVSPDNAVPIQCRLLPNGQLVII